MTAGLGVLMAELEARGELDNTLIVVSGDHGIPGDDSLVDGTGLHS